ncbi:uncharacterized protein LOC135462154 [Liolophura sinensis]|uniref:uncharacterized protein LOC135462154 n=1 Tax=Liolophura sinensis TaxID=3198878 RepID=UPI003159076A
MYHVGWLPWRLDYFVPVVGIHISVVHILILVNAAVCLLSAYVATHGSPQLLGTLCTVQTVVFISTEILLRLLELYTSTLIIYTGAVAIYISVRLYQVNKLPWTPAWFSSSCHMTKIATSFLCFVSRDFNESCAQSSVCLFPFIAFLVYVLMFDGQVVISEKEAYTYIGLVYILCGVNVYSTGKVIWLTALGGEPCLSDLTGLWVSVSGLVIFILSRIHFPALPILQHFGPFSVLLGAVIIFLQPGTTDTWVMTEYWGSVLTVPFLYAIVSSGSYNSINHIIGIGFALSFFPSSLLVSVMYVESSIFLHLLWLAIFTVIISLYFLILKSDFLVIHREMYTLNMLYGGLSSLGVAFTHSVTLFIIDRSSSASVSRNLTAIGLLALSLAAKIYAVQNQDIPQRLINEHKLRTKLPLVSNATVVITFLLLSASCPFEGSPRDLWFVMSSASLLCLQWDKWWLTKFCPQNQITPMLVVSISILLGSAIYNSAFWQLKVSLASQGDYLKS